MFVRCAPLGAQHSAQEGNQDGGPSIGAISAAVAAWKTAKLWLKQSIRL
jgi:hypothetical protein